MTNNCPNHYLTKQSGLSHTQTSVHTCIHTGIVTMTACSCREFVLIESAIVPELINSVWLSCRRGGSHYHYISMCMQNIVVENSSRCLLCECSASGINSNIYLDCIVSVINRLIIKRVDVERKWHLFLTFCLSSPPTDGSFHIYYYNSERR